MVYRPTFFLAGGGLEVSAAASGGMGNSTAAVTFFHFPAGSGGAEVKSAGSYGGITILGTVLHVGMLNTDLLYAGE